MPDTSYVDDVRLAHILADTADALTLARFKALDLQVSSKPDMTEVTDADLAVEDAIRATLKRARARDAVHGEEREDTGYGPRRWVIDPIDGTRNFVRGVPVWATLIALMEGDEVVVGLASAPALQKRWWASRGNGAYTGKTLLNASRMHVSSVAKVENASLVLQFRSAAGSRRGAARSSSTCCATPGGRAPTATSGATCCWPRGRRHRHRARPGAARHGRLDVIVREAGGRFTNLDGLPGPVGPGALATNGLLHDDLVARLTPSEPTESIDLDD
jgi:histidinol-phosphatase